MIRRQNKHEAECNGADSVCASEPQRTGYEKGCILFSDVSPNVIQPHILFAVKRANTYYRHCFMFVAVGEQVEDSYEDTIHLRIIQASAATMIAAMAITESGHLAAGTFFSFAFTFEVCLECCDVLSVLTVRMLLLSAVFD